jgi:hypothetical protein
VIAADETISENLYSQDDALFLLGEGFTKEAAREAICEACRSGELESRMWRRRYWFTGCVFLEWVSRWFQAEVEAVNDRGEEGEGALAPALPLGDDAPRRLGARSPTRREGR